MSNQINNPIEKLKTGKRRRPGRPKGKFNRKCVDCNRHFHAAPSHISQVIRCPKCRKGMKGKRADWRETHTCPLCEGYKHHKSKICHKCWKAGRRVDERGREKI